MAKMTQVERMLRHMTDYGSITSLEAMQDYGIMRAASRINDIKRLGYRVHTEMQTGKNRYGEPTRYALYRLEDAM